MAAAVSELGVKRMNGPLLDILGMSSRLCNICMRILLRQMQTHPKRIVGTEQGCIEQGLV
jgi:hypothetical protein